MSNGLVGIVMRTRDRPLLLSRAFESVLTQTFADWRLVVINDGGQAKPVDGLIAESRARFAGRVRALHSAQGVGPAGALNQGVSMLDTRYCVVHDDDDTWHPEFLGAAVSFLESPPFPSFRGVITHSAIVHEHLDGHRVCFDRQLPFNETMRNVTLYDMAAMNNFSPISFVYRSDVHHEIGLYREDLPVKEDWDFNLRFLLRYDIGVIPRVLAYYHHRVELSEGAYSNTLVRAREGHDFYEHVLRNAWLREDLQGRGSGLGFLSSFSKAITDLTRFAYAKLDTPAPADNPKEERRR